MQCTAKKILGKISLKNLLQITDIFSLPDKWSPTFNCRNNTTQGTLVRSFITLLSNQH